MMNIQKRIEIGQVTKLQNVIIGQYYTMFHDSQYPHSLPNGTIIKIVDIKCDIEVMKYDGIQFKESFIIKDPKNTMLVKRIRKPKTL